MALATIGLFVAGATPRVASTQARPALTIELPADSLLLRQGPLIRAERMLSRERTKTFLNAGFPVHLHVRIELLIEGRFWLDNLQSSREYDMFARYVKIEKKYEVILVEGDIALSLGKFDAVSDAERAVGRAVAPRISGARIDRPQYYVASLVVETLSERDLDDLAQWLRGDVGPGIRGGADPASLISKIVKPLATRLLGGEKVAYEATTAKFRVRQ